MNIRKVIEAFRNYDKIGQGIYRFVFTKKEVEAVAKERMDICNDCELLDTKGDNCLAPGTQPCCSDCGCSLKFKIRSLSSACPKGKWEAILTEEEEEVIRIETDEEE
jgi:hypothetical protein